MVLIIQPSKWFRGNEYIFDVSDSSKFQVIHLRFKDGSGNSFSTSGVTVMTAGNSGANLSLKFLPMLQTQCVIIVLFMVMRWVTQCLSEDSAINTVASNIRNVNGCWKSN